MAEEGCIYCMLARQYSGEGTRNLIPIPATSVDGYEYLDSLRNHIERNQ